MDLLYEYLACLAIAAIMTAVVSPNVVRLLHSAPSPIERDPLTEEELKKQVARGRSGAYTLLAIVPIVHRLTPEVNWLVLPFAAPLLWYGAYRALRKLDRPEREDTDASAG